MLEKAILTGSRAYGVPKQESDLDLVVLVDPTVLWQLSQLADNKDEIENKDSDGGWLNSSFRFGKLNLIAVQDETAFKVWKQGTEELIALAIESLEPVTRLQAIKHFRALREKHGVPDTHWPEFDGE